MIINYFYKGKPFSQLTISMVGVEKAFHVVSKVPTCKKDSAILEDSQHLLCYL